MKIRFSFFLMNKKGLYVLQQFIDFFGTKNVDCVIAAEDKKIQKDYYGEIQSLCQKQRITFYNRTDRYSLNSQYSFAIGWKWMIQPMNILIILHDSLLPKYRGFAPLISALMNKEKEIGVTALFAASEYDRGNVIEQRSAHVSYPITIQEAIDALCELYFQLIQSIAKKLLSGTILTSSPQDEKKTTYSLWRDEDDYVIDWKAEAKFIKRFIDAVGYPYKGASAFLREKKVRILNAEIMKDVKIENRMVGKIIFLLEGQPVIVCGKGLLKITKAIRDEDGRNILPIKNMRQKFTPYP